VSVCAARAGERHAPNAHTISARTSELEAAVAKGITEYDTLRRERDGFKRERDEMTEQLEQALVMEEDALALRCVVVTPHPASGADERVACSARVSELDDAISKAEAAAATARDQATCAMSSVSSEAAAKVATLHAPGGAVLRAAGVTALAPAARGRVGRDSPSS
jgi:hypothetical protein